MKDSFIVGGEMLTHERLVDVLSYDSDSGVFRWNGVITHRRNSGPVGTLTPQGYVSISIDYKKYRAHRLAWMYVHGSWPNGHIDHINMNKADNRINNLRDVNRSENGFNRSAYKNNTTGIKGISFNKRDSLWQAEVKFYGKRFIKTFKTSEEAGEWAKNKREELHGEFVRHK